MWIFNTSLVLLLNPFVYTVFRDSPGFPDSSVVKNLPAMQETLLQFLGWEDLLEKEQAILSSSIGLPCGSAGKESACNAGDAGLISGLGRPPGEGKGSPLQYSGLEHSMDCVVHGVPKIRTQLSDFHHHHPVSTWKEHWTSLSD